MMRLHWLASMPQRRTLLRGLGISSSLLLLSSLVLPWLLLPFQSNFPCGVPSPPRPSNCPAIGEVAFQVSIWQVFTQQVPHALPQPITFLGMLPVAMAGITLALLSRAAPRHLLMARLSYLGALVVGMVAEALVTVVLGTLSPLVITTITDRSLLLIFPYVLYLLMLIGSLTLFLSPDHYQMGEHQTPAHQG